MLRFRPLPVLTVATLTALAILVALGNWQMRRLAWKEGLVAQIGARATASARPLDEALAEGGTPADLAYTRVRATGRFDHAREAYVFTTHDGVPGFLVVTPLLREAGPPVLVERGFVPERARAPQTRPEGQIEGTVEVVGLLRPAERPGLFTPQPDLAARIFYAADLDAIAAAAGVAAPAPVFVAAEAGEAPGGLPQGGVTELAPRNPHLGYALTWYGFAVVLVAVYLAYHRARGRLAWR
ncbi:MAG: SURF1 family protein [Alphaproteobacteria bacterium]|nr:SURF1 family protein [Alphaproteobacteria bacterium]